MRLATVAALIVCALPARQAEAGGKSVKRIRTLLLCSIGNEGVVPVDYKTGDRISRSEALKGAKKIDSEKLAKLSYQELSRQFAAAGVTVVEFEDFYAAYEAASKAAMGKVSAEMGDAGKKSDATALAGIQSGMSKVAAGNPAMAAAQDAAHDGGPKGHAGGAVSDAQMAAILNNPNIPEETKALLRKSAATNGPLVTGGAQVMGIPPGMRDGTAASRFNAGQKQGQQTAQGFQQIADTGLSTMKSKQAPMCPQERREAGGKRGQAKQWFWQALDKVGADGYAKVTLGVERGSGGGDAYAVQTNALSHALRNDAYHEPFLSMDASFFDKNGETILDGLKKGAPGTSRLKGRTSAELQSAYEQALPSVAAELAEKLYK